MKRLSVLIVGFAAGAGFAALVLFTLFPSRGERVPVPQLRPGATPGGPTGQRGPATRGEPSAQERVRSGPVPSGSSFPENRSPEEEGRFSFIRGKVVFGAKREALPTVLVRFSSEGKCFQECFSDAAGNFGFGFSGAGRWTVTALPFGKKGILFMAEVDVEGGGDEFVEIVVPERKVYDISGRVTGDDRQGIAGAKVNVEGKGVDTKTLTGPDGRYELRGVEVILPPPEAHESRSMAEFEGFQNTFSNKKSPLFFSRPGVGFKFTYPGYEEETKWVVLADSMEGRIICNAVLASPGQITVTVIPPGGEILDGESVSVRLEKDGSGSRWSAEITGNRFVIEIHDRGRLILGGLVGRFWIDVLDLGMVDRSTRRDDVLVKARPVPRPPVILVDRQGVPIGRTSRWIRAKIHLEEGFSQALEVEAGRILLPVFFKTPVTLEISGTGIEKKKVRVSVDRLPEEIALDILPPVLTGKLELPPGFRDWDKVSARMEAEYSGGTVQMRNSATVSTDVFDRETGEFELAPLEGHGWTSTYTVTITIPGYKPWVKKDIRLKRDGLPERVVVTFAK